MICMAWCFKCCWFYQSMVLIRCWAAHMVPKQHSVCRLERVQVLLLIPHLQKQNEVCCLWKPEILYKKPEKWVLPFINNGDMGDLECVFPTNVPSFLRMRFAFLCLKSNSLTSFLKFISLIKMSNIILNNKAEVVENYQLFIMILIWDICMI